MAQQTSGQKASQSLVLWVLLLSAVLFLTFLALGWGFLKSFTALGLLVILALKPILAKIAPYLGGESWLSRLLPLLNKNLGWALVVIGVLGWLIVLTIQGFQSAMVQEGIWP